MRMVEPSGTSSPPLSRLLNPPIAVALSVALAGCGGFTDGGGSLDAPDNDAGNVAVAREIEEADIIKLVDGFLYLSNSFTGLRIIDVRDINAPTMAGGLPISGRGVELFVRDGHAFVLTSADFRYCAGEPVGFDQDIFDDVGQPGFVGSQMWVINVTDPDDPQLVTTVRISHPAVATRRVGDVIYIVGSDSQSFSITSLNIADPANAFEVESTRFNGAAKDIHVSQDAVFAVGNDPDIGSTTLVRYIDISDPGGILVRRDSFRIPGTVQNRFFVDVHNGVFRAVTSERDNNLSVTVIALYTYNITNPDDVQRLARVPLVTNESLRSVRFDGNRGYAVTFRIIDPLFVMDLSDPRDPQVVGELEVPGFSTHLIPLGDRLVGVGFDDRSAFRPAVSLYDVSNPANPRQLDRVLLGDGGRYVSSEATVDEKAIRVLPGAGLIMLPFAIFDIDRGEEVDALQLIEMSDTRLTQRGDIEHRGLIRRSDMLDERVWILSDLSFQVIGIDNLSDPKSIDSLDIISEQALLDSGLQDCADSARFADSRFFVPFEGTGFQPCGTISPLALLFLFLGLASARSGSLRRRRRSVR